MNNNSLPIYPKYFKGVKLLPPANEVSGKVIVSKVSMARGGLCPGSLSGGGGGSLSRGGLCCIGGGLCLGGVSVQGGSLSRRHPLPRHGGRAGRTHLTGMHSWLLLTFVTYHTVMVLFLRMFPLFVSS